MATSSLVDQRKNIAILSCVKLHEYFVIPFCSLNFFPIIYDLYSLVFVIFK